MLWCQPSPNSQFLNRGLHFYFVLGIANLVTCAVKIVRVWVLVSQNTFLHAIMIVYSGWYWVLRQSSSSFKVSIFMICLWQKQETLAASSSDPLGKLARLVARLRTIDSDLAKTAFTRANQAKWLLVLVLRYWQITWQVLSCPRVPISGWIHSQE